MRVIRLQELPAQQQLIVSSQVAHAAKVVSGIRGGQRRQMKLNATCSHCEQQEG